MYFPDDVFKIIKSYVLVKYRIPLHYLAYKNNSLIQNYYIERNFYEKCMSTEEFSSWFAYNSLLSYKYWWFSWNKLSKKSIF